MGTTSEQQPKGTRGMEIGKHDVGLQVRLLVINHPFFRRLLFLRNPPEGDDIPPQEENPQKKDE